MAKRLTRDGAVRIAKAHGLDMPAAAALLQLADTEDEAERHAATFADDDSAAIAEQALSGGTGR